MLTKRLGFRWGKVGWGLAAGAVMASACGGSSSDRPSVPGPTGTGGKGHLPSGGTSGGGGEDTGATGTGADGGTTGNGTAATGNVDENTDAPVVTITSPVEEKDPNGENVIVDELLDVTCIAKAASDRDAKIDPATVSIDMLDADGNVVQTVAAAPSGRNEYTASFITTKVADNGVISFKCSATDDGEPPLVGTDAIVSFIDHGPEIIIGEPAPDSQHALEVVNVSFRVKAAPVAKGDSGAAVDDVTLSVAGVAFDLTKVGDTYSASVDLADSLLFKNAPDGATPVSIRAANRRAPNPGVNDQSDYTFVVDGTGPEIVVTQPKTPQVIGGDVTLLFDVTDSQSGVDPDSVVVRLNGVPHRYDADPDGPWRNSGSSFSYKFDARQFDTTTVQTTITVEAFDRVGNKGDEATENVYLDNVAPVVDLDPPAFREYRKATSTCSLAFDPLGPLAANDLARTFDFQQFRAFVYDRTNEGENQHHFFFSDTDVTSVYVYLQPDPSKPLLTDTDGDGVCDDVIAEDPETHVKIPLQQLTGLLPTGSSWFGLAGDEDTRLAEQFPIESAPAGCGYETGQSPAPEGLCPDHASDMTRVVAWDVKKEIPVVFVQGPSPEGACTGIDWQIGHQEGVSDGWVCVAAVAKDHVGNRGVSQPLRLCFDDGTGAPPECLDPGSVPPSCRQDCSLPPKVESWELEL
jgi:hypothetical protein